MGIAALADAVIQCAWTEAFGHPVIAIPSARVHEAWAFLTAENGDWAQSRADWCDMAGRNAANLRKSALAKHADYLAAVIRADERLARRNADQNRRNAMIGAKKAA